MNHSWFVKVLIFEDLVSTTDGSLGVTPDQRQCILGKWYGPVDGNRPAGPMTSRCVNRSNRWRGSATSPAPCKAAALRCLGERGFDLTLSLSDSETGVTD